MKALIAPIAITTGEPAGIGPDLIIQLAQQALDISLVVLADTALLKERAQQLNLPFNLPLYSPNTLAKGMSLLPISLQQPVVTGHLHKANAAYVIHMLKRAITGCVKGEFAALVTGPVHKGIINDAGFTFTGHTEFLAEYTHTAQVVMMLATEKLRVALATTHLPLAAVASHITQASLTSTIQVLYRDLQQKFSIAKPRILVCGLNPHAGENGHLGREEIDIIIPVLNRLRQQGLQLIGPLPADTLFTPKYLDQADAVLSMYHDQGLPVLKYQGFGRAVNITLGLPIIRTSVDHGTALDIAGTGQSDVSSLMAAIRLAHQLATRAQDL